MLNALTPLLIHVPITVILLSESFSYFPLSQTTYNLYSHVSFSNPTTFYHFPSFISVINSHFQKHSRTIPISLTSTSLSISCHFIYPYLKKPHFPSPSPTPISLINPQIPKVPKQSSDCPYTQISLDSPLYPM